MPWNNLPQGGGDFNWFAVLMMIVLSLWGGFVNYLSRFKAGVLKRFNIVELLIELVICSFAGVTIGFIALSFNVNPLMSYALAAIAGHAGGRTVYFADKIWRGKLKSISEKIN
jgi:acyl-CoA synthetase (AMP-forming)/AMP-acid ligase II